MIFVQCVSLSVLYSNFLWLPFVLLWLWKITAPTPSRQSLSRLSRTWLSCGLLFFCLSTWLLRGSCSRKLPCEALTKVWPQHCQPSEGECTIMDLRLTLPGKRYALRSHQVPFAGTLPGKRDFPRQSHSVDARRDFSRWSHQTCWVRGRKSDLGLVIDIAQLFSSNVRMRELWWHGDLTHSPFAQQKPLNRDCPRKAGAFDDSVKVGRKKDKTSPNCPGNRDLMWTQGWLQ